MNCREIRYSIPDYIRGTIDPSMRNRIDEHLGSCRQCSSEAEGMREILNSVGTLRIDPPSDLYWNTILPRLHQRMTERSPRTGILGNAIPVSLTLSLILVVVFIVHLSMDTSLQGLRDTLRNSQPEDLQMITDQQSIAGITEAALSPDDQEGTGDKESLVDILSDSTPALSNNDEEVYISLDNFSDQEIQKIVSAVDVPVKN